MSNIATSFHCGPIRLDRNHISESARRNFWDLFLKGNQGPEKLKWVTHINGRTRSLDFLLCARKTNNIFQSASSAHRLCNKPPNMSIASSKNSLNTWGCIPPFPLLWISRVRFTQWGWSVLLPNSFVMWGLPPIFIGRGYHLLSLSTCSLTYQQK